MKKSAVDEFPLTAFSLEERSADMVAVEQLANELIEAEQTKKPIAPFTERFPAISLSDLGP